MRQPRAWDDALSPISARLSKLENVLASRTAEGYLNDFQQTWGSRVLGPGVGLPASERGVTCNAKSASAKPMVRVAAQLRRTLLHAWKIFQSKISLQNCRLIFKYAIGFQNCSLQTDI